MTTASRVYMSPKNHKQYFVVFQDINADNPVETGELLTKFICFHNKYKLGNEHDYNPKDFNGWDELEDHIRKEEDAILIKRLSLYDHSGINLYLGEPCDRWDSGYVGFAVITKESLREFGVDDENLEDRMFQDVETYDNFLTEDVYAYVLIEETKCNCCGLYKYGSISSGYGYFGGIEKCGILDEVPEGFTEVSVTTVPEEVYELRDV